jgi:hypothetical protein
MIECCRPLRAVHLVTFLAISRKACRFVIRILRPLIVATVATVAVRPDADKLMLGCVDVTLDAIRGGVRTDEGKPRLRMPLDHVRHEP